jgi:hypothetical protein
MPCLRCPGRASPSGERQTTAPGSAARLDARGPTCETPKSEGNARVDEGLVIRSRGLSPQLSLEAMKSRWIVLRSPRVILQTITVSCRPKEKETGLSLADYPLKKVDTSVIRIVPSTTLPLSIHRAREPLAIVLSLLALPSFSLFDSLLCCFHFFRTLSYPS